MSERETRTRKTADRDREQQPTARRRKADEPDERRARTKDRDREADRGADRDTGRGADRDRGRGTVRRRPDRDTGRESGRDAGRESNRDTGRDSDRDRKATRSTGIGARRAASAAADYVLRMTGRQPESLTSLSHDDDGWKVGVEALESKRIPDSTDILALYRVELDDDGELLSYRRERRYHRGRVEGDDQ